MGLSKSESTAIAPMPSSASADNLAAAEFGNSSRGSSIVVQHTTKIANATRCQRSVNVAKGRLMVMSSDFN